VLFYLIVLYGCVCQPLINGYDDDDDECRKMRQNCGRFLFFECLVVGFTSSSRSS